MPPELPKRTKQHVVADQGAPIVQRLLPPAWVYRNLEGKGDYGIDAEIEIFAGESPTGLSFLAQVRAHSDVAWNRDGKYVQAVDQSTRSYWRLRATPVVVIVCDVALAAAYWAFADASETLSGVRVNRVNALPSSVEDLERGVRNRLNVVGPAALIYTAPLMARYWDEVAQTTGGDSFLPIDEDSLAVLKVIYNQLPYLRYALALPPPSLVPWPVWVAKSQMAFSDYYELYWAIFDEVVQYLRPLVAETLDAAAERLSTEDPLGGNVTALNWAERRRGGNVSYATISPFRGDEPFWQSFDRFLDERGVRSVSSVTACRVAQEKAAKQRSRGSKPR